MKTDTSLRAKRGNPIKLMVIILVLIFVAGVFFGLLRRPVPRNDGKPTIKIGVSLPLTGNLGYIGQTLKGSVDIAREDLSKRDLKNNYEFILENNAFDNKQIVSINSKFIHQDKVNAIFNFSSQVGLLTKEAIKGTDIIGFNACASEKRVADGVHSFVNTTLPDKEAQMFVKHIAPKYKNLAMIALNEVSALLATEELEKELDKAGIRYFTIFVNPGEMDMRAVIDKAEEKKPDAYVLTLFTPTFEIFYRQLREKGVYKPVTGTHHLDNISDLVLDDGTEYIAYAQANPAMMNRISEHTKTDYRACLGNPYDIIMMLVDAFENTSTQEEAILYLQNLKEYDGVMGETVQEEGGVFQAPPIRKIIKNGHPVVVEE